MSTSVNKSLSQTLIALQKISSAPRVVVGSAIDVSSAFEASVCIHFGRYVTNALTAGVNFRIEGSYASSGTNNFFPLFTYTTGIAASESEALSGTINAGSTTLAVASTTNLTAGDLIYIDNGTLANSEWARIQAISTNTNVQIEEGVTNAQTGSTLYDQAEIVAFTINVFSLARLRVVVDGSGAAQNFVCEAYASIASSLGP